MKKTAWKKAWLCAPLLGAWLIAAQVEPVQAETITPLHTITVSGKGEIRVKPDIAYVTIGLNTTGKTAQEAQKKNADGFVKIRTSLAAAGIPERDIQTVRFSTYPDYSWEGNKQIFNGYHVDQAVQVKYRDLNSIGTLLDRATEAGANRIDNVVFTSEKLDAYRLDATDLAIDNARLKAERMAKRAGVIVNSILSINEGSSPQIVYTAKSDFSSSSLKEAPAAGANQLSPGELVIEDYVTITYSY